ncbi:MAG: hypothetical protein IIA14_03005, partial [SAR324 cluster bacterium]|nr:hypothetical protein [SAR324 cluster bacterium]
GIERYSILRAMMAIERADVILLLLDASELVTAQDTHIAGYVLEAHKGIVITVNKWDLAGEITTGAYDRYLRDMLPQLDYAPRVFISAHTGSQVWQAMSVVRQLHRQATRKIGTARVNEILQKVQEIHAPPPARRA